MKGKYIFIFDCLFFTYSTVDSLEEPEESDLGGAETPAVFSPASSPAQTPAPQQMPHASEAGRTSEGSPEPAPQRQPRRRRTVPQSSSVEITREMIDSRVIEFLVQRRTDGQEEAVLRGLAPLLRTVPPERYTLCVASMTLVIQMYASNLQGDIHTEIDHLRRQMEMPPAQQPYSYHPRPPPAQGVPFPPQPFPGAQQPNPHFGQPPYPPTYATGAPDPRQVRPGPSYAPASFTQDLFEL